MPERTSRSSIAFEQIRLKALALPSRTRVPKSRANAFEPGFICRHASVTGSLSPGLDRAAHCVPRRVKPSCPLAIPFDSPARGRTVHRPSVLLRAAVLSLREKPTSEVPVSIELAALAAHSRCFPAPSPSLARVRISHSLESTRRYGYRAGLDVSLRLCALSCDRTTVANCSVIRLRCS